MRDVITSVLMEPDFLYRLDMIEQPHGLGACACIARRAPANLDRHPVRAFIQLRAGQPPELFPLGQHAR